MSFFVTVIFQRVKNESFIIKKRPNGFIKYYQWLGAVEITYMNISNIKHFQAIHKHLIFDPVVSTSENIDYLSQEYIFKGIDYHDFISKNW